MAKKMRPSLTPEQKKHLAFKRKKGVLVVVIVILSLVIVTQVGFLVIDLIKQAGA